MPVSLTQAPLGPGGYMSDRHDGEFFFKFATAADPGLLAGWPGVHAADPNSCRRNSDTAGLCKSLREGDQAWGQGRLSRVDAATEERRRSLWQCGAPWSASRGAGRGV